MSSSVNHDWCADKNCHTCNSRFREEELERLKWELIAARAHAAVVIEVLRDLVTCPNCGAVRGSSEVRNALADK